MTMKVSYSETNNFKQGRSGGKVPMKDGPTKGNVKNPNPTKSGGIYRAPKSN